MSASEATFFVFEITDEGNSLSIGTHGYWRIPNSLPQGIIFDKLKVLLELRSQNDIELHVKEVEKKGIRIVLKNSG